MKRYGMLSCVLAVAVAVFSMHSTATAQYMYLDANADGANTSADHLATSGSTTIDVWLDTNHNRNGTPATCSNGSGTLTLNSYEFCLLVSNGTATWGSYSNNQSSMTTALGVASSATAYKNGFFGQTFLSPGKYKLGTLTLTAYTGAPSILISSSSPLSASYSTAFGSGCLGRDFDGFLKLGQGPLGPGDWTDVDGIDSTPLRTAISIYPQFFSYDCGADPTAIAMADFNGDALPDIVVANLSDNSLSVFLAQNNGITRSFAPGQVIALGASPGYVAAGDLNVDGRQDLAVTFPSTNGLSSFLGNGDGTFGARIDYPGGQDPREVVISDFGSPPGAPQIIWVNYGNNTLNFHAYNSQPYASRATGLNPIALAVADLGGDSGKDLITANFGSNSVTVLITDPINGYTRTDYAMGTGTQDVAVADLNGDGLRDIVTVNFTGDSFTRRLALPGGGFGPSAVFQAGSHPRSIAVGDLNGDGIQDLTAVSYGEGQMSTLLGDGTGSYGLRTAFSAGNQPYVHLLSDTDGNGTLDAIVVNFNSRTLSVHPGNGDGTFGSRLIKTTSPGAGSIAAGDLNADGVLDAVVPVYSSFYVSTFFGTRHGQFAGETTYFVGNNPTAIAVADMNGDTWPDLAVSNFGSASVSILVNNGSGSFGSANNYGVGALPTWVVARDLNNDSKVDLAITTGSSNSVTVLIGNGNGTFGGRVDYPTGTYSSSVATGDLNGDSRPDLLVANRTASTVSVLLANTGGGFGAKTDFVTGPTPIGVATGDFDHNGTVDVAVACQSASLAGNGVISVLLGNGAGSLAPKSDYATGKGPHSVMVADVNSDGTVDLVSPATYSNCTSVLLGVGNGTFLAKVDLGTGSGPVGAVVGDFSRDGLLDIVSANNSGTLSVLLNRLSVTGVVMSAPHRTVMLLEQNRPNPFNPHTTISYELAGSDHVRLAIFDVHGRTVRTLVDCARPTGRHVVAWDGTDSRGRPLASGVYFYRLQTSREMESRRMVLIR